MRREFVSVLITHFLNTPPPSPSVNDKKKSMDKGGGGFFWLTIRSRVHFASGTSGAMDTQLSSATSGPGTDPPQIRMVSGSVYGAYCGISMAVPSIGYERPPAGLLTAAGILGSVLVVAKVLSSRMRASL